MLICRLHNRSVIPWSVYYSYNLHGTGVRYRQELDWIKEADHILRRFQLPPFYVLSGTCVSCFLTTTASCPFG